VYKVGARRGSSNAATISSSEWLSEKTRSFSLCVDLYGHDSGTIAEPLE
jgi:hypothetical protein